MADGGKKKSKLTTIVPEIIEERIVDRNGDVLGTRKYKRQAVVKAYVAVPRALP